MIKRSHKYRDWEILEAESFERLFEEFINDQQG